MTELQTAALASATDWVHRGLGPGDRARQEADPGARRGGLEYRALTDLHKSL
jgi:hypothetical protein